MAYIIGSSRSQEMAGYDDEDDVLLGLAGDDRLRGLGGNDWLIGGPGADRLEGGEGDDTYEFNNDQSDTIFDVSGWDTIRSTRGIDIARYPEIENLVMAAHVSGRHSYGNALDNEIYDWGGNNIIDGRAGNDWLVGNGGNDILIGGAGVDGLLGGAGDDRFDFHNATETGVGSGPGIYNRDQIVDFEHQRDKINLGRIDADTNHSGNQAFRWLGATAFTGTAGELVTYTEEINAGTETVTVVAGDTDGDGAADFEIELRGVITQLYYNDFIL